MSGESDETNELTAGSSLDRTARNLKATPRLIGRLHSSGVLSGKARVAALAIINGPLTWWPWVEKALLFFGLALTLSGVVCFFAWNWDALPGLVKLAIVQAGIVGCCVAAYQKKIETLPGKAAITAAAVLVGVFLAVFGQVYQTGADAYQLFVGWALLILPWVIMCRLAGLWLLWLAIVNVGIYLFWDQMINPRGIDGEWLAVTLGLLNGLATVVREVLAERGCEWLPIWFRRTVVPASLAALVVPGFVIVADFDDASVAAWCGLVVFLILLSLLYWQFRVRSPDLFILTCAATAITVLACAVVIRVLMEVGDEVFAFFLSGLTILGLVAAMTKWLVSTGRELRATSDSKIETGGADVASDPDDDADRAASVTTSELPLDRLLTELSELGHVSDQEIEAAYSLVNAEAHEESTPWFVQTLIGFGAWIACLLFLGALGIAGLFGEGAATIIVGVGLLGGGAFLDRTTEGPFLRQLALAGGLTGLALTGIGVAEILHANEPSRVTFSLALATAVFYRAFRCAQFRFLACLFTVICATVWLGEDSMFSRSDESLNWGIHGLVMLETIGVGLIFSRHQRQILEPAGYAMAVGLLGTLWLVTQFSNGLQTWPSAVILALGQIWILLRAWQTTSKTSKESLGVAAVGMVVLGIVSAPGVLASLGATLLGHLERDTVLKRLGLLCLPVYLASYYYSLNTTLQIKSLVLVGSGLVLWAARWYFRRLLNPTNLTATETQP